MTGSPEYEELLSRFNRTIHGLDRLKRHFTGPPPPEWHSNHSHHCHTYSKTMCDGKFLNIVGKVCDQKLKDKGNFITYKIGFPDRDTLVTLKKFKKLRKIAKMEREMCGEEEW